MTNFEAYVNDVYNPIAIQQNSTMRDDKSSESMQSSSMTQPAICEVSRQIMQQQANIVSL